jgi:hypothetical protein
VQDESERAVFRGKLAAAEIDGHGQGRWRQTVKRETLSGQK